MYRDKKMNIMLFITLTMGVKNSRALTQVSSVTQRSHIISNNHSDSLSAFFEACVNNDVDIIASCRAGLTMQNCVHGLILAHEHKQTNAQNLLLNFTITNGNFGLLVACSSNNVEVIKLIMQRMYVNNSIINIDLIFEHALYRGNIELIKLLLDYGLNFNTQQHHITWYLDNVQSYINNYGNFEGHIKVINLILDSGYDIRNIRFSRFTAENELVYDLLQRISLLGGLLPNCISKKQVRVLLNRGHKNFASTYNYAASIVSDLQKQRNEAIIRLRSSIIMYTSDMYLWDDNVIGIIDGYVSY